MSFKSFSLSQAASSNDKQGDKIKAAPSVNQPTAEPEKKKQDEVAPARKS